MASNDINSEHIYDDWCVSVNKNLYVYQDVNIGVLPLQEPTLCKLGKVTGCNYTQKHKLPNTSGYVCIVKLTIAPVDAESQCLDTSFEGGNDKIVFLQEKNFTDLSTSTSTRDQTVKCDVHLIDLFKKKKTKTYQNGNWFKKWFKTEIDETYVEQPSRNVSEPEEDSDCVPGTQQPMEPAMFYNDATEDNEKKG
jgi:hypothetical protein